MKFRAMAVGAVLAAVPVLAAGAPAAHADAGNASSTGAGNGDAGLVMMRTLQASRPHGGGGTNNLAYRGGAVENHPSVYIDFWGSQWNHNDPSGEAGILESFFNGLGPETWSTTTDQYCSGATTGATTCPTNAAFVIQPTASPLAGFTYDNGSAAPSSPTQSQMAAEATKIAASLPAGTQIVVATATHNSMNGFGSQYCAWHSSSNGVAYTNLPYITDAGASCGAGFNNLGPTAGITIVEGHEYAETVTDPFPNSGWLDGRGSEIGDKCAWISTGTQGASANVNLSTGTFAVQSLWSNKISGCTLSS